MIEFQKDGLALSVAVTRALLAFAANEVESRHYLAAVGIDEGDVCATDGHSAVRFRKVILGEGADNPIKRNGRLFRRVVVEKALEAAGRKGQVWLPWSELDTVVGNFPRLHQVEPKEDSVSSEGGPIGFATHLLKRLEVVALACRRDRVPGEETAPESPAAVLRALGGHLDPCRWVIGGEEWPTSVHRADVTIMPMRVQEYGQSADAQALYRAQGKVKQAAEKKKRLALQREQTLCDRERARAAKEQALALKGAKGRKVSRVEATS